MKSIEFASEHVDPIQHGRKTATVRVGECEGIQLGDRVTLETEGGLEIEQAKITSAVETFVGAALHAIQVLDAQYPAESTADVIYGLRKHYGPEIDKRTECRVLCWELTDDVLPDLEEIDAEGSA
jgi:hypothetical protein